MAIPTLDTANEINHGVVTVTTATTRVRFNGGTSLPLKKGRVFLATPVGNTGDVYIGDVTVAAANGFTLSKGTNIEIEIDNINKLYADAANNGDKVSWLAV